MALTESADYRAAVRADLEATIRAHEPDSRGRCVGEHLGAPERYPCQGRLWAEDALLRMARR